MSGHLPGRACSAFIGACGVTDASRHPRPAPFPSSEGSHASRAPYSYVLTTRDLQGGRADGQILSHVFFFFLSDRTLNVLHLTFCEFLPCDSCTSEAMNSITVAEEKPERNQSKSNVSSIKWRRGGEGSGGGWGEDFEPIPSEYN